MPLDDVINTSPEALVDRAGVRHLPLKPARKPREAEPPLPLLWFDEIEPVLEAHDFVQGVLSEAKASVIYGDSNAGKTFWTTDLALHIAAGKRWNDRRVDQGGVIYCTLEGASGFRNRVAAWTNRHGCKGQRLPFAAIPVSLDLLDPETDTPRLIATIKGVAERMGVPVKLIVIDTLARAIAGGNENSSEDMGALVRNMSAIQQATGAHVMFIHHCGKDAAKGARGHSSLRAAIDTEIEVIGPEGEELKTARVTKQRDMQKGGTFAFRLDVVDLGQNQHGEPVTTCTVEPMEGSTKPSKARLTDAEKSWAGDLQALFAEPEAAQVVAPRPGMTPVPAVRRDQLRGWLTQRGRFSVSGSVPLSSSDRTKLQRMLESLKNKGLIAVWEDWVWLL